MLDMVLAKTDQRIIKFYEECLGDKNLKIIGEKAQKTIVNFNLFEQKNNTKLYFQNNEKNIEILLEKEIRMLKFLNILQADIMKKLYKKKLKIKDKKFLTDAMLVTIAGIAAAMKNVG